MEGETTYSEKIPGVAANYNWPVQFDTTDGFLRVSQYHADDQENKIEIVLLCPSQIEAMLSFLKRANKASTGRQAGKRSKWTSKSARRQ
jgi:hypothetical protein